MGIDKNIEQIIVTDGIVKKEVFDATECRVMVLLKEVNDRGDIENWAEYIDVIRKEAEDDEKKAHWTNLNYWIDALYQGNSFSECTNQEYCYQKSLNKNMLKIALVNVKKTPGKETSKDEKIYQEAINNKYMLAEQIEQISPKLVICGGTYECAKVIFPNCKEYHLPCGMAYFVAEVEQNKKLMFVDFVHPSIYGIRANILYTYAKCALAEAKAEMKTRKII